VVGRANEAAFVRPPASELGYWAETIAWATWPAWPLALWTLWDKRRRTFDAGTRMLCLASSRPSPLLLSLADPREVYALPLLLPLSLLAGAGAPTLRAAQPMRSPRSDDDRGIPWRDTVARLGRHDDWGSGFPCAKFHAARARVSLHGSPQQRSFVALALTFAWFWLVLKGERSVHRGPTFWAAGITLVWGLAMTLILPWIDYGKSYRPVAESLKRTLAGRRALRGKPWTGRTAARGPGLSRGYPHQRLEREGGKHCPLLLVQIRDGHPDASSRAGSFSGRDGGPRDRERYQLYRRPS